MADREEQVNSHIQEEEVLEDEAPPQNEGSTSEEETEKNDYDEDFDTRQEAPRNLKPSPKKRKADDDDDDDDSDEDLRPKKKTSGMLSDEAFAMLEAEVLDPSNSSDLPFFREYIKKDDNSPDINATEQDIEDLCHLINKEQNGFDKPANGDDEAEFDQDIFNVHEDDVDPFFD